MDLDEEVFLFLKEFIYKECGIVIPDNKKYLVKQRVGPLVSMNEYETYKELCDQIKNGNESIKTQIIEALTTNETFFMRDVKPFDAFLGSILPNLVDIINERKKSDIQRKGAKVNIWCAASSTGQEPYSLAMLILEYIEKNPRKANVSDFSILASDVNPKVLAQAIEGKYNAIEMGRGISDYYKNKYFYEEGKFSIIKDEVRKMVEFRKINLLHSFSSLGGFDIVFCRNVLIYFDIDCVKKIISGFEKLLSDQGMLMLGSSENLYGISDAFNSERIEGCLLYKKK